jgi:hypothetical protein
VETSRCVRKFEQLAGPTAELTKLSLSVVFAIALLAGLNSVPSLVYAQADEEAAQPSERPQTDNAAQPDQTATPAHPLNRTSKAMTPRTRLTSPKTKLTINHPRIKDRLE